mgnify:CR=1 FL=1
MNMVLCLGCCAYIICAVIIGQLGPWDNHQPTTVYRTVRVVYRTPNDFHPILCVFMTSLVGLHVGSLMSTIKGHTELINAKQGSQAM